MPQKKLADFPRPEASEPVFRFVSLAELKTWEGYGEQGFAELAEIFQHDVVLDMTNCLRWKTNRLIHEVGKQTSMNMLAIGVQIQRIGADEFMKFCMQSGYSLGGFWDLFSQHAAYDWGLPKAQPGTTHRPGEHVIDYMLRIHQGKVLRL